MSLHLKLSQNHMATTFDLTVSCAREEITRAREALSQSHLLVSRLEGELSEFILESPVARINRSLANTRITVPKSVIEILELSAYASEVTAGAFDSCAKSTEGQRGIKWDPITHEAWKQSDGTHLGFGAIGKGYALDRVREILAREGFENFLLVAGGSSLVFSGFAAQDVPWSWGWSWKRDQKGENVGIALKHSRAHPIALGISGLHEKGNHIKDPLRLGETRTGRSPLSALVGHPSAALADAFSTALFLLDWEEGIQRLQSVQEPPALALVDSQGIMHWNGIFESLWGR